LLPVEQPQPLNPPPPAPAPRRTWLIVVTTISLLVALAATGVAVLAMSRSQDALHRLDDAESRLTAAEAQAETTLASVSDVSTDGTDSFIRLQENTVTPDEFDAEIGRVDERIFNLAQCNNLNWEEFVNSTNEDRAGNFSGC